MTPDAQFTTIQTDIDLIRQCINELIVYPRGVMRKWARITGQTPAAKMGYIGQHLASLITGVPGTASGARGDDLADKTEVKACNKVDQVDKCKNCGGRVMRMQNTCPHCGLSEKFIDRKADSKWLFSIRDEHELQQYKELDRIFLLVLDYPQFGMRNFNDVRIRSFEIYPKEERMQSFCHLIDNHYYNIYLPKANQGNKTNPMNLHPDRFQFFMCNPIKTFECIIHDIDSEPEIDIRHYLEPTAERGANVESVKMPVTLLYESEFRALLETADFRTDIEHLLIQPITKNKLRTTSMKELPQYLPYIDEDLRRFLPLREIVSVRQPSQYQRG